MFKTGDKVRLKKPVESKPIEDALALRDIFVDKVYIVEKMSERWSFEVIIKDRGSTTSKSFFARFFELAKSVGFVIE